MEDITNILSRTSSSVKLKQQINTNGGFLSHGGTPSHYPCFGILHHKPSSYWGIPMTMEPPLNKTTAEPQLLF